MLFSQARCSAVPLGRKWLKPGCGKRVNPAPLSMPWPQAIFFLYSNHSWQPAPSKDLYFTCINGSPVPITPSVRIQPLRDAETVAETRITTSSRRTTAPAKFHTRARLETLGDRGGCFAPWVVLGGRGVILPPWNVFYVFFLWFCAFCVHLCVCFCPCGHVWIAIKKPCRVFTN